MTAPPPEDQFEDGVEGRPGDRPEHGSPEHGSAEQEPPRAEFAAGPAAGPPARPSTAAGGRGTPEVRDPAGGHGTFGGHGAAEVAGSGRGEGAATGRGEGAGPGGGAPVTPADAADAARLVAFGLQPKLVPARDVEYAELLRRHREDPAFARLADAVAAGLGLVVLEVSTRAGMAVAAAEDSVFAVRMGEYARRSSADSADRFLHGLAHLAIAALAFPRPQDLADDGYIGRITVNGVDAFVRQACRRLEERAAAQGENTDPATGAPGLESAWRVYARRSATGATKDARRLAGSTTGIVGKAVAFLVDSGFLQRTGDESGGTYRTTARYQLQVRDMAGSTALTELLQLGVVPAAGAAAALVPPDDTDDLDLVAGAGLPFHPS